MTLWYPGRSPFCTAELINLLEHFIDNTHKLIATRDDRFLCTLKHITRTIHTVMAQENNACYGTDRMLNALRILFENTLTSIQRAWQNDNFDAIFEIATNIRVVCDTLREECGKVTTNTEVIE